MKLILSIAAATAMMAIPAAAMTREETARFKIERFAPDVDTSTLSDAHIAALLNVMTSIEGTSEGKRTVTSLARRWQ